MDADTFQQNLEAVHARIRAACERCGRDPSEVGLVAVSKTYGPEIVSLAAQCGVEILGENRVQEARAKIPQCPGHLRWHLIGHLQTNKVKFAVQLFDMIHSIDSAHLLDAVQNGCDHAGKHMPVLLEVNVSGEGSKYGMPPEETPHVLEKANACMRLEVRGLMTIPPFSENPEKTREHFQRLRALRDKLEQRQGVCLPDLSMGMSHDFEIAIEEGATWVRVGTALFGKRS